MLFLRLPWIFLRLSFATYLLEFSCWKTRSEFFSFIVFSKVKNKFSTFSIFCSCYFLSISICSTWLEGKYFSMKEFSRLSLDILSNDSFKMMFPFWGLSSVAFGAGFRSWFLPLFVFEVLKTELDDLNIKVQYLFLRELLVT